MNVKAKNIIKIVSFLVFLFVFCCIAHIFYVFNKNYFVEDSSIPISFQGHVYETNYSVIKGSTGDIYKISEQNLLKNCIVTTKDYTHEIMISRVNLDNIDIPDKVANPVYEIFKYSDLYSEQPSYTAECGNKKIYSNPEQYFKLDGKPTYKVLINHKDLENFEKEYYSSGKKLSYSEKFFSAIKRIVFTYWQILFGEKVFHERVIEIHTFQ